MSSRDSHNQPSRVQYDAMGQPHHQRNGESELNCSKEHTYNTATVSIKQSALSIHLGRRHLCVKPFAVVEYLPTSDNWRYRGQDLRVT